MSKAILVLDEMPKNCADCAFEGGGINPMTNKFRLFCQISGNILWDGEKEILNECPLKPFPQKKEIIDIRDNDEDVYEVFANKINVGYNRCIDELLGGKE